MSRGGDVQTPLLDRVAAALAPVARRSQPLTTIGARREEAAGTPGPDWLELALSRARPAAAGGSYTHVLAASARREAARTDGGVPLGGWTFAVKDLIAVRGLPVGAGSAVRAHAPVEGRDAPAVARLRAAGAVCVGAVTLHEFAFGVTGRNDYTGTPENPRDRAILPGGSSSGSATAVAEGSARVALGTDTGGSIRIPAALCEVVGFKPANTGRRLAGVFPLAPTLDQIGYVARSVVDAARAQSPSRSSVAGDPAPVLGVATADLENASPAVSRALEAALRRLERAGARLTEVASPDAAAVFGTSTAIMFSEAAAVHAADMAECPERYGSDVLERLRTGQAIPSATYVAALERLTQLRRDFARLLADVDCVVGPTLAIDAPELEHGRDPRVAAQLVANTRLANLVGAAALTLPLGGPGVALQVTAGADEPALRAAAWIERRLAP